MANKLINLFREKMDKSKSSTKEAVFDVLYPTGFLTLDYLNGTMVHVNGNDMDMTYNSCGIMDGSSNTFIGRSGCGKSTFVIQLIGNMLRSIPGSTAYIDDIEGSLPISRKEFLLGLSEEELKERVYMRNTGITTENVYDQIRTIHDIKIENRANFEYDTGLFDIFGNRIYKLVPTFYFIDSFAMLMPNDVAEDDEIGGNMTGSSVAKTNTAMIKKISQLLKDANIILFTINHILDDIQIGFLPKPAQISGLKQGERMSGGRTAIYLANNMFRLDDKTTLKAAEGYGIDGSVVDITVIKSRTNANKRSVPLIFDKSVGGFDNILSTYHFLKSEGYVGGAGRSMYFNNAPDVKFSQKEFKSLLMKNTDLQKAFVEITKEAVSKLLSDTSTQKYEEDSFDLNKAMSLL